jgi:hypothetical protein
VSLARHRRRVAALHPYTAAQILALGPFAWWKADALALANGADVTTWADSSGNGHTVTPFAAGKEPRYDTNVVNGLGAVRFEAANLDNLRTATFTAATPPGMAFVVCRPPATTPAANQYVLSGTTAREIYYRVARTFGLQGTGTIDSTAYKTAADPVIVTATFDTTSVVRLPPDSTSGSVTIGNLTRINVGGRAAGTQSWDGYVCEVLYFTSVLTTGQRQRVERYLAAKWGASLSAPSTVYVDSVAGDDAANGSSATPVKTLAVAAGLAGPALSSLGAATIVATSTQAAPFRETLQYTAAGNLTIRSATSGTKWWLYASTKYTSGWASLGGGVWSQTISSPAIGSISLVMVTTLTETIGDRSFWLRLQKNTATPTTPAAGQFGISGTTCYVRLPADANPNSHTIEVPTQGNGLQNTGNGILTPVDAEAWCAVAIGIKNGAVGSTGSVDATDCGAQYCTSGFGTEFNYGPTTFTRTRGWANLNDGHNIHGDPGENSIVTCTDVDGSYNDDEGISPHDDTHLVITGSSTIASYNGHGGATCIGNAVMDVLAGRYHHNMRISIPAGEGAITYIDATNSGQIAAAVEVDHNTGAGIMIKAGATVTLGAYSSHDNGAADNLAYP